MQGIKLLGRYISNSATVNFSTVKPSKMKLKKSHSSKQWLLRQMNDPYVEKAKFMNYRCRSAFKLIEIDDKYKIFNAGDLVIDCGAAPGSWTQVAVTRTNSNNQNEKLANGTVISIDLLSFQPIQGATILGGMDFTQPKVQDKIKNILKGRLINCIISDMAPNATGIKVLDQENIINICYSVLKFSTLLSSEGANLLIKVWDGGDVNKFEKEMMKFYENVRRIKPKSSRQESAEIFLLAKNFKKPNL